MTRWSRFPPELCVTINGEMFFESGQSIRPEKVKETHQWEECAANSREVWSCPDNRERWQLGSSLRRVSWRVHDESVARADGDDDENVSTTRPLSTGASQRACSRSATRGRCESGARVQRRQGLPRTKAEETGDSTSSADRSIKQCGIGREVPADHEAQGQKCSDDCRSQESEVADVRQTTAKRRLESWTKRPRRQIRARRCTNSMAWKPFGNKASPRERCPLRTGQCRHGWTQEKKTAREGTQNPRTKRATTAGKSRPTAGKKSIANCRQRTNNHHSYRGSPDTDHPTRWQRRWRFRQCSKVGSSAVTVHQGNHRDPCLSAEAHWIQKIVEKSSITVQWWEDRTIVLSVQKIAEMLQVKSTGKRVDDTEIMRTSSGNPSSTVNSENASDSVPAMRQSGEHSSCATDSGDRFSGNTETDAEHQEDPEAPLRSSKLCRDSAHHPGDPKERWGITGTVHGWDRGDARCDERQGRANQTRKKTWRLSQI